MNRGIECALCGSASRDGEVRTSKSGNEFGIVNLMTQDGSVGDDGKPVTTFIKVLCFGQHVNVARQVKRADRVYCEGALNASIWKTNDGEARLDLTLKAFKLERTGIGKNRPTRDGQRIDSQAPIERQERAPAPAFNDEIGF